MPYCNYPTEVFEDLRQLMQSSAERFSQRTLLIESRGEQHTEITYGDFKSRVEALGAALWARGLKGKKILLCGRNGEKWATAYMAVVCGLGVAVPIDRTLTAEEVVSLTDASEAEAIIAPATLLARIAKLRPAMRRVAFEDFPILIARGEKLLTSGKNAYLRAPIDPDAMAVIVYTSGTTGKRRGVMLSHRNLCFNLSEMCRMVEIRETDIFLSVLPLHHAYECTCGFLCPLYRGAAVAFGNGLRYLPRDLRLFQPTVMLGVPLLIETLHERIWAEINKKGMAKKTDAAIKATDAIASENLRISAKRKTFASVHAALGGRLRLLISGGAEVNPDVLAGFRAFGITALQGYGLSECAPLAALNRDRYFNDRSAGLATPNTLLDIFPAQDDGRGEIRFKGDNVMLGYYNDPDASAEVLRDGWLYTGDIGYVDENGFLFITGRKKNVIVTPNGKNISPEELEELLDRRPYIKESLVMLGEHHKTKKPAVVAVVVPDFDKMAETYGKSFARAELELEMKRAVAEVNATLQRHKRIESYLIRTDPLPRNAAKKILREEVKKAPMGD